MPAPLRPMVGATLEAAIADNLRKIYRIEEGRPDLRLDLILGDITYLGEGLRFHITQTIGCQELMEIVLSQGETQTVGCEIAFDDGPVDVIELWVPLILTVDLTNESVAYARTDVENVEVTVRID